MIDPTKTTSTPVRTLSPAKGSAENSSQGASNQQPVKNGSAPVTQKSVQPLPRKKAGKASPNYSTTPFWLGMSLSVLWVATVIFVMMNSGGMTSFAGLPLTNWAIGISAIISPVAMIWMIAAYLQRAADVQSVTEPLRRQLAMITGESGAAEIRVRRFNQAIKEQLDLLRSTKHIGDSELLAMIERINAHKADLEQFETQSIYQVKEIQDVIDRSMQHIEKLMEDKFTMLRVLDSKLVQSGDSVAHQTEGMRDQIEQLLADIESHALLVASSVEEATKNSKKLSDTTRAQETSLISAAETASATLQELSGRIDTDIAHFLGRTGLAREEAERLATALDTQTRSLDELSSLMPSRISEAESVLRGVADRLYASEQLAREQAASLSAVLSEKTNNLQAFLDKFASRVNEIDSGLQQRQSDLDGIVVRISGASNDLGQQLETTFNNLSRRAESTLESFASTNKKTKQDTDIIATQLSQTAARYEDATLHLESVSNTNSAKLKEMSTEISAQLSQFETLQNASEKAGTEVQQKAAIALENLQQVLERLLSTREATQSVGDILTEKLMKAAEGNERIIDRINQAASASVQALSLATESLGNQENIITNKTQYAEDTLRTTMQQLQQQAHDSEKAMRAQNDTLVILTEDVRSRLDQTDKRLQDFADMAAAPIQQVIDQIEQSSAQGRGFISQYGNDLQSQLDRLQLFNNRISEMGLDVGKMTSETLTSIEDLNMRFETARKNQEATTRAALEQFDSVAQRLHYEVETLGSKAGEAATTLQDAATQVGKQSYQLSSETQDSSAKISAVTNVLQNEAKTIRKMLEEQAQGINVELAQAGERFQEIGHTLKEKTDTAYALLDRVAAHYNEITNEATTTFEDRANKLNLTAIQATEKVTGLSTAMEANLSLIKHGTDRIQSGAGVIAASSDKTVDRLEQLNARLSILQTTAVEGTVNVVERIQEATQTFKQQNDNLSAAAEGSIARIQQTGSSFGEQASHILDVTHQVETSIRSLSEATSGFAGQSAEIRAAMEQHNGKLISSLKDSIAQLDTSNARLQETSAEAIISADNATTRYDDLATKTSSRLDKTSKDILRIADETDTALGALTVSVTKQVAALNIVSDQISAQHKTLTSENENQHAQLLDLFNKLGTAHTEASGVAERTISRLDETLDRVQNYLGQLSDHSQTALANVTTAGAGFAQQATKLIEHACQAEEQARTAMNVTNTLQEQAKQLRDALHNETDRASEMLSSLLGRLASGSGDIRDISATANAALTDIQSGIDRQTGALNDTMDKISARQDTLTKALDAQRETLAGLITNLSSAQDQTANAAESAARRLTDGTSQITSQLEKIETKAKVSLANVQMASEGFAKESSALSLNAEAAEKQTAQLLESTLVMGKQATTSCNELQLQAIATEQTITTAIDKLGNKSTQLQTTSQSAEKALDNLSSSIKQHTSAIDENLERVTDKQTLLSTALESQREMLSGMITRLTLAQDETAAAAERSAARLTDSTGQISRQMNELDEQTQNALAAVRAAGNGLADESTTLADHTHKAEQQIRDMLKTTGGMHEETNRIRQAMQTESNQVIEQVHTVMKQLENTVTELKQQGGQAQNLIDKSALDLGEVSKNVSELLEKQASNLSGIAQKTQKDIAGVNEKITENTALITNASILTKEHGLQLSETAEKTTTKLVSLISQMSESDTITKEIFERADKRLTATRTTLETELQNIANLSQKAVEQVMGAGSALAIQSDALRANLSSSESALASAADTVREETSHLPNLLGRSSKEIEAAVKNFKIQTTDISDTMLKTTDRCISATGAIRDTMMDEARHLTTVTDTAQQTLTLFNDAMMTQIKGIKDGTSELSNEQKNMIENATQTITQLSDASNRLTKLRGDTALTTAKLAHEFEAIELRATETTKRLAGAGENLSKQVAQLISMTEKAEGQMGKASKSFREQLETVRNGVQTQIEDINRGLMQITAQLDRTGTSLRSAMAGTVVDVEKIATRFDQTSKETANQLSDRTSRMRVATEEVSKLLNGFGTQIDVLLDRLNLAGDGIKRHEGDLVEHLQEAFSHLGSVAERLDSTRVLSANVSEAAVSKLSEVSQSIEKQMRHMAEGGQKVATIIQTVAQTYVDQTQKVNGSVLESQEQIIGMGKSVEEMQQRTDRMRVTLKLQGDDLLETLENVLGKLSGAGTIMNDAVDGSLQQTAMNSLKKISS